MQMKETSLQRTFTLPLTPEHSLQQHPPTYTRAFHELLMRIYMWMWTKVTVHGLVG